MAQNQKSGQPTGIKYSIAEMFGLDPKVATLAITFAVLATGFAVFWFFHSAPPMVITITSGRDGSGFHKNAEKYAEILRRSHVELRILSSEGSPENLKRLADPKSGVDVGLVEGGVADENHARDLVSLGSVNHQPMLIFYRASRPLGVLSQFEGKRLAIGPDGSGTHSLALTLLADNGIKPGGLTSFSSAEPLDAVKGIKEGRLDAVFLMGDSAPSELIREMLKDQSIRLFSFAQANAYVRRFNYLNRMVMPRGAIDFGKDLPPADVELIGPTVEIIARPSLDPALTDLLLEAAQEVHSRPGLFKQQGEFPAPQEHEFRLSAAAQHFYKSGKSFFYRFLPFWVASMVDRILVTALPLLVILIPGFRAIPAILRWRINLVIYRWYRLLLKVEHEGTLSPTTEQRASLLQRIDRIEQEVNAMDVPVSYATQFYELRGHINFVRSGLTAATPAA